MASKSSYNRYTSSVEPSTCGTSWTSVRFWNKPTSGYRGHSSRLASSFEPTSTNSLAKTPSYSLSPASSRPSSSKTSEYASSYTRSLASNRNATAAATAETPSVSYRTNRDIFSPSRFSGAFYESRGNSSIHSTRNIFSPSRNNPSETDYMSKIATTSADPPHRVPYQSLASKTPVSAKMLPVFTTPTKPLYKEESSSLAISKAMLKPIPKSERPWRQRMADAARLREERGFDTSTTTKLVESRAARRNSIGQKSGDELQTSLNALKDLVSDSSVDKNSALSKYRIKTTGTADLRSPVSPSRVTFRTVPSASIHLRAAQLMSESYSGLTSPYSRPLNVMSRSYSPIRTTRSPIWSGSSAFSPRDTSYTSRYSSRDSKKYETLDKGIKPMPRLTPTTETTLSVDRKSDENNKEHQPNDKKVNPRSSRERTARRNSRQRSQSKSLSRVSSSSDEDAAPAQRDPPKKRRLRKRTASLTRENDEPPKDVNNMSTSVTSVSAAAKPPQATTLPEVNHDEIVTNNQESMYETPNDEGEPLIKNITGHLNNEDEDKNHVESFDKTEEEFKSALSSLELLTITTMGNKSTKESKNEEARQIVPYKKSTMKKKLGEFKLAKAKAEAPVVAPPEISIPNDMPIINEISQQSAASQYSSFSTEAPLAKDEISWSETISDTQSIILDDDETKFNAVAEFKPKHLRRKKSPAPVPGMWIAAVDEVNISKNKHFVNKILADIEIECIMGHIPMEQAISPKIRVARRKLPEENKTVNVGFKRKSPTKESAAITILGKRPVVIYKLASNAREKLKVPPVTAIAVLNKDFANKKRLRLGIEKIFFAKGLKKEFVKLSCKAAFNLLAQIKLNVVQNEQAKAANVTVLSTNIMDVNWALVKRRLKASVAPTTKKALEEMIDKHTAIIAAEKEKLEKGTNEKVLPIKPPSLDEEDISASSETPKRFETHASIVLHRLRTAEPGVVANNHLLPADGYRKGDPVVLPDRSVLEEYVQRKRGQLERLQSEPLHAPSPLNSSRDVSPCHSSASELQPACAVRIVEPPQRAVALITPSKDRSRLSSVESATSFPPPQKNMLDIASYAESNIKPTDSNHIIGADFRTTLKPTKRESLNQQQLAVFDEPKSPFEAHLQNHATNMLRKSNTANNIPDIRVPENENRDRSVEATLPLPEGHHKRRSSVESISNMPPISGPLVAQSFAQAAAMASQPRHERYAAHIPVYRSDNSGRQSTTSIDSNNSSSLDAASRQLDQMIDQARYRHHQHRAKFKEAIDYLDQIFEDLKKECEPPPATAADKKSEAPPPSSRGIQAAKAVFQKPKAQPTSPPPLVKLRDQRRPNPVLTSSHSLESNIQQQRPQPPPHRTDPILQAQVKQQPLRTVQPPQAPPNPTLPSFTNLHTVGPKPFPKDADNDVDVSETIVLPRKRSDRMDFTQKWLVDDIKSWAENPPAKPDLILNPNEQVWENGNESDEHSVGSCSAEVAAINASDGRKKKVRETPDIIKSSKHYSGKKQNAFPTTITTNNNLGPIRPQPFRPQPQYAFPSTSNMLNPNENNPYYGLQKAPSQDYITAVQQQQERAGSQEYQSIGSVHSQDGYKPPSSLSLLYSNSLNRTGAFSQYPPRGSIQSLPDANLMKPIPQRLLPLQDPVLAIDALVAELELNTDQANLEKRRSFPTSNITDTYGSLQREYEKPRTSRGPVVSKKPQPPTTLNVIKEPIQAGSMDRGMRRIQQQKASLDEVTNLLSTFANGGDVGPPRANTNQQQQQSQKKLSQIKPIPADKNMLTPFETINSERINPSRVEAMQHMFEAKPQASSNNSWRKNLPRNTSKEEENYYEINEFTVPPEKVINKTTVSQFSPPPVSKSNRNPKDTVPSIYAQPNHFEYVPAFPVTQPPPGPPPGTSGSCGSANSGYYSSTSLTGHNPYNSNVNQKDRPISFRKPSISSRNGSFEEEDDDGFYDNIQVDNRRFSRGSELDNTSVSSRRLPPTHKGSRLGQLIRRIGGTSKPPGSAASLVSLNKAGIDQSRAPGLMKSNSLSNEPWNAQFINNKHELDKKNAQGFGQRIKQSIFGSKKRLHY